MPLYRFDIIQGSDEWHEIKVGKMSASVANDLLMKENTAGFTGLIDRLVEERYTGHKSTKKSFQSEDMLRGTEFEPEAALDYEMRHLIKLDIIGVVILDDWTLCSPDRLIDDDGLYQAKCPSFTTQRQYLKDKKVPTGYYKQMQFELYVTGRKYNVFHSYHPELPSFEVVVERDEAMIKTIHERVEYVKELVTKEIQFIHDISNQS